MLSTGLETRPIYCLKLLPPESGVPSPAGTTVDKNLPTGVGGVVLIGRKSTRDVVIPGHKNRISKKHAIIELTQGGRYTVSDTKSNGGVAVNGLRLHPNKPQTLVLGDKIYFGGFSTIEPDMLAHENILRNHPFCFEFNVAANETPHRGCSGNTATNVGSTPPLHIPVANSNALHARCNFQGAPTHTPQMNVAKTERIKEVPSVNGGANPMNVDFFKKLGRELECPVCWEPFTKPRILECSHTLCAGCVEECEGRVGPVSSPSGRTTRLSVARQTKSGSHPRMMECPTCRQQVPSKGSSCVVLESVLALYTKGLVEKPANGVGSNGKRARENPHRIEPPLKMVRHDIYSIDFAIDQNGRKVTREDVLAQLPQGSGLPGCVGANIKAGAKNDLKIENPQVVPLQMKLKRKVCDNACIITVAKIDSTGLGWEVGLREGDVLHSINGDTIHSVNLEQFYNYYVSQLRQKKVGIVVLRGYSHDDAVPFEHMCRLYHMGVCEKELSSKDGKQHRNLWNYFRENSGAPPNADKRIDPHVYFRSIRLSTSVSGERVYGQGGNPVVATNGAGLIVDLTEV